ncbi:MAG: TIGR04211 family SH3 domain-containing protein, partial [Gammaproteobacteria bacterium]|nr:TIGR04211 family SH3 domain-containing protein [Gammaproteobacteria bacterium]
MHLTLSSKNFTRIILLFLFAIHLSVGQAEAVYVDDRLRVGVRNETGNRVAPHAIVYTGMKLEILEEDGNFIRIKTEKGIEGWIKKTYVTSDRPAKDLLAELRKSHDELKSMYEALKNEATGSNNGDASEKIEGLQKQNRDLRKQAEKLNKKISSLSADKTGNKQ